MKNSSNNLNSYPTDSLRLKPVQAGSAYGQTKGYEGELRISVRKKKSDRVVSKRGGLQGFTCG